MEIPRLESEELRRYCINANPLLWGVLEARNKKKRLEKIQELGFLRKYSKGSNPTYSQVNQELLIELGIEGILDKIIIPIIRKRFKPDELLYFRRCWEEGKTPGIKYLKEKKLYYFHRIVLTTEIEPKDPALIFVQIDTQKDFVERWTVFAGLWFEIIEPLIEKENIMNRLTENKKEK